MKRLVLPAILLAFLSACATTAPSDQAARGGDIYSDTGVPGRGVHLGIGAGSWGGRSGGGVGIGLGF